MPSKIKIIGSGLLIDKQKTIVFGDLHLGYEESMLMGGVSLFHFHTKQVIDRITVSLETAKPKRIVFVGDIKHSFGRLLPQEWRDIKSIIKAVQKFGEVVFIEGNHDKNIQLGEKKLGVSIVKELLLDDILVCHGHVIPDSTKFSSVKIIIIGHEHPAVSITNGIRTEVYKAFLRGRYGSKELWVLPSLSAAEGTDLLKNQALSPFLKNIEDFDVFLVDSGEPIKFGRIGDLR